jgi:cytoskeletal protein RodZ
MVSFQTKEIYSAEMIGSSLQKLRGERGFTIEAISSGTKIQKKYLEALEKNNFETLGHATYINNFIKAYAKFLGADPAPYLNLFRENLGGVECDDIAIQPRWLKEKKVWSTRRSLRNILLSIVALALLGYISLAILNLCSAPTIAVAFPPNDYNSPDAKIEFRGKVPADANLKINGQNTAVDENGNFVQPLELGEGLNVVKLSAERKHSKEKTLYWRIFYGNKALSQR